MVTRAGTSALEVYRAARRRRRKRLLLAALCVAAAGAEAARGWGSSPVLGTLAVATLLVVVSRWSAGGRDIETWRRGALGERVTADLLAGLSSRRWTVWHDLRVPGSRANIDHLVVGRTGVWVVDTKTTRARVRTGWRSVRFGGRNLDVSPTRWEADVVSDALAARLGDGWPGRMKVRPIVVVHGEGMSGRGRRVSGVPVVPADELLHRLQRGRRRVARARIGMVVDAVDQAFSELRRR